MNSIMPCALEFGETSDWWIKGLFNLWTNLLNYVSVLNFKVTTCWENKSSFFNCVVSESKHLENILADQFSPL